MRIEGPAKADPIKKNEKTKKSGGVSGSFSAYMEPETENVGGSAGTAPAAGMMSLLAAQSVEDPTERKTRKRMMERADKVLGVLDEIREGLLEGNLSTETLARVGQAVAARREKINDPKLVGLLDEVDLRAQVEIAKLEMARDAARSRKD